MLKIPSTKNIENSLTLLMKCVNQYKPGIPTFK